MIKLKIIILILGISCFQCLAQKINLKINNLELNLDENLILENRCEYKASEFGYFEQFKGISLYLPVSTLKYKSLNEKDKSYIYDLKIDNSRIILTVTEYPEKDISLEDLVLLDFLKLKSDRQLLKNYRFGLERIQDSSFYWVREVTPSLEFKLYSTMFYYFNNHSKKIYLLNFSTSDFNNCKNNKLMIDVLNEIVVSKGSD
ncbi:hypothetical protein TOREUM_40345 [Tenacibaculum litoreum]